MFQMPSLLTINISKRALLAGLVAAMGIVTITQTIARISDKSEELRQRDLALVNVSELHSSLEGELSNLLLTARGIVAYIELHGDIGQPEFSRLAASLVGDNPLVINMALLEGSTVKRAYPLERNKSTLGLDVLTLPGVSKPFLQMQRSGQPTTDGPRTVVQGNRAFVSRVPIYRQSVINSTERGEYWGSTAIVFDANTLYERAGLLDPRPNLSFAIRRSSTTEDPQVNSEEVFFGDPKVFEQRPITQKVRLPGNNYWDIGAVPKRGWHYKGKVRRMATTTGYVMAFIVGFLTLLLVRKQEHIHHIALHDTLSGLPNRHSFFDRFELAINMGIRHKRTFAVLLLDLDGFKAVNDGLGHAAGDELIQQTAERLSRNIRSGDMVARYGGDEFVVLIDNSNETNALRIAKELCLIVPQTLPLGNESLQISASIGLAMYPKHATTMSELLSKADEALYKAKNNGKNRVVVAEITPEQDQPEHST